ncbi:heat shock protein [Diplodia corticola]|uniref:Heat shock protein n=1 Tax=Diplodia corticola TaxID=236234 RepID=A0A1J9RPJ1_9PEZI|nr:heat shock protein [Diplodia corticola]OJD34475.1 heat shock protein [Diplodia corticola]
MPGTNQYLSVAGWWFLPTVVGYIQSFLYSLFIRAGDPRPQPGSPKFIRHKKIIQGLVVIGYLVYSIYEADWELQRAGNFYQALGVPVNATEKTINTRFRRLTVLHHPDKVTSAEARPAAERYYVFLKQARDILVDPAKRFAYDRFGPGIVEWKHCITVHDFVMHGVQSSAPSYLGGASVMIMLGMLGYFQHGSYWRYLAFAALVVFECHTISRPDFPPLLTKILNPLVSTLHLHAPWLPYQILSIVRKGTFASFIAMNQLGPLMRDPKRNLQTQDNPAMQQQQLDRLTQLCAATDTDALRLLGVETMPFQGEDGEKELKAKMKGWLVQNSIRSDPVVRDAVGRAVARKRQNAPAGARGTT